MKRTSSSEIASDTTRNVASRTPGGSQEHGGLAACPGDESPTTAGSVSVAVQLDGLTLQAGERTLLLDASADFDAGAVTLIVGRSGVGKSTLLRAIAGLLHQDDDQIRVSGRVRLLDGEGRPAGNSAVGVVFQDFALFDELSPLDNVRLARAHRRGRGVRVARCWTRGACWTNLAYRPACGRRR